MDISTLTLMFTGLSLGMLHAFDADHIMAVTSLSAKRSSPRQIAFFCGRWALGHGATVMLLAILFIAFDWHLSEQASLWAERFIGVLLLSVGLFLAYRFIHPNAGLKITTHQHADGTKHTHIVEVSKPHRSHLPVSVGIVHGVAGSGPLLAVLPALIAKSSSLGILYVALFSIGVLLSMLCFGLLLGFAQSLLYDRSETLFRYAKGILGLATALLGFVWLKGTF